MKESRGMITLPCECRCCMLVVEKTAWEDGEVHYSLSIQDSRYDHAYNTLWGRLRRAAAALFGKPIYYNDVSLEGEEGFRQLIEDMRELAEAGPGEKI